MEAVVRLMPEYECGFPLWGEGTDLPPEYAVDQVLREDLLAWNELFLDHFSYDKGWTDEQSRIRFSAEAPGLLARFQELLGPEVKVVADLWPK
jgi:hypothetical protein